MIAVIGENIVDLLMQADGSFKPHLGGSPFNVAIGIGRQSIPCAYLTPVSEDIFGVQFVDYLATNDVHYAAGRRSPLPSSIALVTLDHSGHPHYSIYRHHIADRDTTAAQLIQVLPDTTRILHTGSLALEPQDLPAIIEVLNHTKKRGIKISVDINVRLQFVSDVRAYIDGLQQIIPLCDYLKASDEDLAMLYPGHSEEQAINIIREQLDNSLLAYTKGDKGARLITNSLDISTPVITPSTIGDTVGAGDTFYACLLAYLHEFNLDSCDNSQLDYKDLHSALIRATIAASINVSRHGCLPPTRSELLLALGH